MKMEEMVQRVKEIAKKTNKTYEEAIAFMKYVNMYVDECNMGDNELNSIEEIDDWWKDKTDEEIIEIYEQYDGLEALEYAFC